jgi:hypothetical protein
LSVCSICPFVVTFLIFPLLLLSPTSSATCTEVGRVHRHCMTETGQCAESGTWQCRCCEELNCGDRSGGCTVCLAPADGPALIELTNESAGTKPSACVHVTSASASAGLGRIPTSSRPVTSTMSATAPLFSPTIPTSYGAPAVQLQQEVQLQQACHFFATTGGCRFGPKCRFRHEGAPVTTAASASASLQQASPPRQPLCRFVLTAEGCRFGSRCRFRHPTEVAAAPSPSARIRKGASDRHPPRVCSNCHQA